MTPPKDLIARLREIKALQDAATEGNWGIEDPFGHDALTIVANPKAPTYEWRIVASCFSDEEDDDDGCDSLPISKEKMKSNGAFIAASRTIPLSEIISALERVGELEGALREAELARTASLPSGEKNG